MSRFYQVKDGEWVAPKRKGYKMACCDCGLVHTLNFALVKNKRGRGLKIIFQASRNNRSTVLMRRGYSGIRFRYKGKVKKGKRKHI